MTKKILILLALCSVSAFAKGGEETANSMALSANTKVAEQWKGIFDEGKFEKMFRRSDRAKFMPIIEALSKPELEELKSFLMAHAADSDQPKVAGGI